MSPRYFGPNRLQSYAPNGDRITGLEVDHDYLKAVVAGHGWTDEQLRVPHVEAPDCLCVPCRVQRAGAAR